MSYIAYYNVNVLETIIINKEYYLNCKGLPHIFLVQLNPLSTSLHFCRDLFVFLLKVYCLHPFYWYISVFFSLYQSLRMLRYKHSKSSTCPRFPFLHIKLKRISFSHNMSLKGFNNISPLISMSTIAYLQSCWNVAAYAIQMKSSLYLLFVGGFGKDLGY